MPRWLKNNAVLALGVSLPLLLIAALLLLHGLARLGQVPPKHPVVYASFDHYSPDQYFEFRIDAEGRLQVLARHPEAPHGNHRPRVRTNIAVFDAESARHETYALETPEGLGEGEQARLSLPRTATASRCTTGATAGSFPRCSATTAAAARA